MFFFFSLFSNTSNKLSKVYLFDFFFHSPVCQNKLIQIYFLHFFFSFLPAIGRYTKIYIYIPIFFFSRKVKKKILKIYFNQFSSVLHTVNSKICFPTPMCYLPKHTNIHIIHTTWHTQHHTIIHQITQNTSTHACSALVLFRDFLGNRIPKPNI